MASVVPRNGNKADKAQDILAGALLLEEIKDKSLIDAVAVTGHAILSETQIANQNIAAFDVGGEKWCCLPQILNGALAQISLPTIHAACDELQLSVSTCTPEQLEVLKKAKIIPNTANSCGLIIKSDAELLCSMERTEVVGDTGPAKVASAVPGNGNKADRAQDILAGALLLEELKNKSLIDAVAVTGHAILSETQIANRNIAAFDVGGEKWCCLPQILTGVLAQINLPAIHAACDELQIYCSTCTPEQLDVFKKTKIVSDTANSCGLITKSDAARLCSRLLERPEIVGATGPAKVASVVPGNGNKAAKAQIASAGANSKNYLDSDLVQYMKLDEFLDECDLSFYQQNQAGVSELNIVDFKTTNNVIHPASSKLFQNVTTGGARVAQSQLDRETNHRQSQIVLAGALPVEELKTTNKVVHPICPGIQPKWFSRKVTSGGAGVVQVQLDHETNNRQNLETILEAVKGLQVSKDSHKVI